MILIRKTLSPKLMLIIKILWCLHWFYRASFVCLFSCLGVFVPLENFSLIWKRHHCRLRAANFDLCSALMAIKQWGFSNMPYLLWHGPTLYKSHLRGPVTLTPVTVELSLFWSPTCETTLYHYATAALYGDCISNTCILSNITRFSLSFFPNSFKTYLLSI